MNSILNLAWNFIEYLDGPRQITNVLWLYAGCIYDSMMFNIVEYVLEKTGYIK